jgi:hypothetical protein
MPLTGAWWFCTTLHPGLLVAVCRVPTGPAPRALRGLWGRCPAPPPLETAPPPALRELGCSVWYRAASSPLVVVVVVVVVVGGGGGCFFLFCSFLSGGSLCTVLLKLMSVPTALPAATAPMVSTKQSDCLAPRVRELVSEMFSLQTPLVPSVLFSGFLCVCMCVCVRVHMCVRVYACVCVVTPGYFSPPFSLSCTACAAGLYAPLSNTSACTPCPAGRFSGAGAAVCSLCPIGTFNPSTGASVCSGWGAVAGDSLLFLVSCLLDCMFCPCFLVGCALALRPLLLPLVDPTPVAQALVPPFLGTTVDLE